MTALISTSPIAKLMRYFAAEEKALEKSEYYNGKVVKMAGGTLNHSRLSIKVAKLIDNFVEDSNYDFIVADSNLKVWIETKQSAVYPDALVICQQPEYYNNRRDTIVNPTLAVEVLSNSTKKYDTEAKFDLYRTLPSFKEYVLISQKQAFVDVYTLRDDGVWEIRNYKDNDIAILKTLNDCPLSLERLYRGIEF